MSPIRNTTGGANKKTTSNFLPEADIKSSLLNKHFDPEEALLINQERANQLKKLFPTLNNEILSIIFDVVNRGELPFSAMISENDATRLSVFKEVELFQRMIDAYQAVPNASPEICRQNVENIWKNRSGNHDFSSTDNKSNKQGKESFLKKLRRFGLETCITENYLNEREFQTHTADVLRKLTFKYLKGELKNEKNSVISGPVRETLLREIKILKNQSGGNLEQMGLKEMEAIFKQQTANGIWAESAELSLTAELLDINLGVRHIKTDQSDKDEKVSLHTHHENSKEKLDIILRNSGNTHWEAEKDGKAVPTVGNGNCGYNALALSLRALYNLITPLKKRENSPIIQSPLHHQEVELLPEKITAVIGKQRELEYFFKSRVKKTKVDVEKVASVLKSSGTSVEVAPEESKPTKISAEIQAQIDADYQYALKIAEEEMRLAEQDEKEQNGPGFAR